MPRGVRMEINYEEELSRIEAKISNHKQKISNLQNQRKSLLERKQKSEMEALYHALTESGKTPSELLAALSESKQESA